MEGWVKIGVQRASVLYPNSCYNEPCYIEVQVYCDVTKVEVPNCVLTGNMRNEFVAVRVYQAVKNPATTDKFAADFSFMPE